MKNTEKINLKFEWWEHNGGFKGALFETSQGELIGSSVMAEAENIRTLRNLLMKKFASGTTLVKISGSCSDKIIISKNYVKAESTY